MLHGTVPAAVPAPRGGVPEACGEGGGGREESQARSKKTSTAMNRLLVVGREGQPGREVAGGGPAGHVGADPGDEAQRIGGADAVDLREVGAGEPIQRGADIEARVVVAGVTRPRGAGSGAAGTGTVAASLGELGLDGVVADRELALTAVKELKMLLEGEDELGAVDDPVRAATISASVAWHR
ncbi:MAG: hypothetical protein MZV64_04625 [Ignavibacteriales bacterium]|nr:hypothetical protein [Ignavibacteriales bacterium]